MKRPIVLLAITTAVLMVGCGSTQPQEPQTTATAEPPAPTTLGTPEVKDGVARAGEDCAEVYFEWAPIEGADGYEVSVANKYFAEKDYREPETVETTEANYVDGAQDLEELAAVLIVSKNVLAVDTAQHHVVNACGAMLSANAWHS